MPKKYSTEFKDSVVEFYERGHSVNETITEYGICESSLFEWKKDYDKRNPDYIGDVLKRRDGYKRADHEKKLEEIITVMNITRCKPSTSTSEKMIMIKALEDQYSIHVLCEALHLPRGTYYNRKKREGQLNRYQEADEKIKPLIREVSDCRKSSAEAGLFLMFVVRYIWVMQDAGTWKNGTGSI